MITPADILHVLCVDDNLHVLGFVTTVLEAEGHEVETALDGQHALQKISLRERPYDLIIVDARMPHLDGFRFVMQARAGGYKGRIIVFSGHLDEHERQRFQNSEIDRIIEKPMRAGDLVQTVREVTAQTA